MLPIKNIVVVAPEVVSGNKPFPVLDSLGRYNAGNKRMMAVPKLHYFYPQATFIMVGGVGLNDQGQLLAKADVMAEFVKQRCPRINLEVVHTLPSTFQNFLQLFRSGKALSLGTAILSNEYHQERLLLMWQLVAQMNSEMLNSPAVFFPAEYFVKATGQEQKFSRQLEERLRLEKQGAEDLRLGRYQDACLTNRPLLDALARHPTFRHLVPAVATTKR